MPVFRGINELQAGCFLEHSLKYLKRLRCRHCKIRGQHYISTALSYSLYTWISLSVLMKPTLGSHRDMGVGDPRHEKLTMSMPLRIAH